MWTREAGTQGECWSLLHTSLRLRLIHGSHRGAPWVPLLSSEQDEPRGLWQKETFEVDPEDDPGFCRESQVARRLDQNVFSERGGIWALAPCERLISASGEWAVAVIS